MPKEIYLDSAASYLSADITNVATSIAVASGTPFPAAGGYRVKIDQEIIYVSSVASNTLTVLRGQEGSTAAAHLSGAAVVAVLTDQGLRNLVRQSHGGSFFTARREMNFVDSTGLTWALTDDAANDKVDITATVGAGGGTATGGGVVPGMATLVPPVLANFTWVNQGSATASVANGVLAVAVPNTGGYSAKSLLVSVPGVPWTAIARIHVTCNQDSFGFSGICVRDATAKASRYGFANGKFYAEKMTSDVAWSAYQYQISMAGAAANSNWVKVQDDGTSRIISYSVDGVNWWKASTVTRTDWVTPTHVGLQFDTYTGGDLVSLVSSWSLTTP